MLMEQLRPIYAIPEHSDEITEYLQECKEPFLFLEKDNELQAYVELKDSDGIHSRKDLELVSTSMHNVGVIQPDQSFTLPLIFHLMGEPIVIVHDESESPIGFIEREDVLIELFQREHHNANLLKILLSSIPMGMFIVDKNERIMNSNDKALQMIRSTHKQVVGKSAGEVFQQDHVHRVFTYGETLLNQILITDEMGILVDYSPIKNGSGVVEGALIIVQDLPMVEQMAMEIEFVKDLNRDLNAVLSTMYDEVLIVDKDGTLLRHSDKYIEGMWPDGIDALVGKNLLEVDLQGLPPSVTKLVLKQQKKVSIVQEIPSGDKVLAIGNPVFNTNGELERIIIASRDITENIQLKSELRQTKAISNRYKEELESLKNQKSPQHTLIYASEKMERIMKNIEKLSMFSSTVLIQGETGVGKELIAKSIHEKSARSTEPFLALNCGSIPETLLESELFGYTKGSFTGADSKGKPGYFQQADRGVLFLDEIGDIPMSLQVKLLRVLQEGEVVPIGSQTPIRVDVQIIAATHRNLEEMVQEGSFREDLFYRINVVPLSVPPLRERPEDIPLLAYHFIRKLNERYQMRHSFSPDALSLLETYAWPGNIRELQNVVERLFVTADDDLISAEAASQFLRVEKVIKPSTPSPVLASVMPLNDAKQLVENQLLRLAMEQFKTTTKAARALGISQSAVSRKWAKLQSETSARE